MFFTSLNKKLQNSKFLKQLTLLLALIFAGLTMSTTSQAIDLPKPDLDNPEVQQKLDEVEAYFETLTTMQGRFIQANPNGSFLEGSMYMHRPGRMRFEYDEPIPFLLVADGSFFIHVDKQLEQVSHIPLSSTPANFLLGEDLSLREGLALSGYYRANGLLRLKLHDQENPELGNIILTFTENPMALKQWTIEDSQKNTTTVTLIAPRFGGDLDPELFVFRNPWQKQPGENK